jgi:hypothetical protein
MGRFQRMIWQVHYQRDGRQFRATAPDRTTAIAVASILVRDGHDVVKIVSSAGETIEKAEIRRLCGG